MGIAILGVLIGHWFNLSGYPANNILFRAVKFIPLLVFTQGFLLLSGFGLFYSFSKNGNVESFYQRRFTRLFIPFIIMICPFLVYFLFVGDINGWQFLGRLSTISYWFECNYYGMWYIALSIVLYLLYPCLHRIMMFHDSYWSVTIISLLLMIVFVATTRITQSFAPEYYQVHSHAFNGAYMFVVGSYLAYLSKQEKVRQYIGGIILFLIFFISFLLKRYDSLFDFFYGGLMKTVIFIPTICIIFEVVDRFKSILWIRRILEWLGTYTLEIYLFHLLFYCLLTNIHLGLKLQPIYSISIAEIAALLLCVPINKGINMILNRSKKA